MTGSLMNACAPSTRAGMNGASTEAERAGAPTRHADKEIETAPARQSREVVRVNVATGRAITHVLPAYIHPPFTSGDLTTDERLLLHDEQYPAAHNQMLAVLAASAVVERGTAKTVPVLMVQLLLQELDRVNATLSVQSRRIADLLDTK